MKVNWKDPNTVPVVKKFQEKEFWIAVKSSYREDPFVFLAFYQNRPLEIDSEGDAIDGCLIDPDGEPIESIGWVYNKENSEFENYYETITFREDYKLLGWADYTPPKFTGVVN